MTNTIKFAVLRTNDGHAMNLLKPNAKAQAGVAGVVEVLAVGGGKPRVTVNGVELQGHPAKWPKDVSQSPAEVVIELIADDAVVDTKKASVAITGLKPAAPAQPETRKATEQGDSDAEPK